MYLSKSKYKNEKTVVDGIVFSSRKEAQHYSILKAFERKGIIKNLQLQTQMPFLIEGKKIFTYKPDFEFDDQSGHHIVDVKGVQTPVFRLKKKLIEAQYGCKIELA